jgi:hypothetical protein
LSNSETLAARIGAILREGPSASCVDCLAGRLMVSTQQIREAAQVLLARPQFTIVRGRCFTCGQMKDLVAFGR